MVHDVSLPDLLLDNSNSAKGEWLVVSLGVRRGCWGGQEPTHDFGDPVLCGLEVGDRSLDATLTPVVQVSDGAPIHHDCVRDQDIEVLALDEELIECIAGEEGS